MKWLTQKSRPRMTGSKLSPLVGESVNRQVDERGKLEQTRKNGNKYEQTRKK